MLDVQLPGIGGLEVLRILKENYPYTEAIVVSAIRELDAAIEAMRDGAYQYISQDFDAEEVKSLVAKASERQDLNRSIIRLNDAVEPWQKLLAAIVAFVTAAGGLYAWWRKRKEKPPPDES